MDQSTKDQGEEKTVFKEKELPGLVTLFHVALIYLAVLTAASLSSAIFFVSHPPEPRVLLAIAGGLLGSAIAALMSCVQRRADGFEDSYGKQVPESEERKDRFNRGMFYWFLVRPWLGGVVGAVAYWSLVGKVFGDKGDLDSDLPRLAFYSFIAGLFAKSLLEIFGGLLKNVFKK
jgi:predicted membrane-bound spermidine synthase